MLNTVRRMHSKASSRHHRDERTVCCDKGCDERELLYHLLLGDLWTSGPQDRKIECDGQKRVWNEGGGCPWEYVGDGHRRRHRVDPPRFHRRERYHTSFFREVYTVIVGESSNATVVRTRSFPIKIMLVHTAQYRLLCPFLSALRLC